MSNIRLWHAQWMLVALACLTLVAGSPVIAQVNPSATARKSTGTTRAGMHRPPTPRLAAKPTVPQRKPLEVATAARIFEEQGAYALAAAELRALRGRVAPDADLELALALDEARSGQADSAWARFHAPLLQTAMEDTAGVERRSDYPFQREPLWMNGRFDGWYWYVARARAELAISRGLWREALDAATISAAARPLSGKEMLLLSLCAAHAGESDLSQAAAAAATVLEPALPEGHYLRGLLAWRAGRRTEAQSQFRTAAQLDSSYRPPALALPRTLLAGARPDSLPAVFLTGARAAVMLTSSQRPKLEEFVQMDETPAILHREMPPLPQELKQKLALTKPLHLYVHVLVSEAGAPLIIDLPYLPRAAMPPGVIAHIAAALPLWRFRAPVRLSQPQRGWATVEYILEP